MTHKYSVNSHEPDESSSHEYPKVQNMEEISLMSLEKDLKTLEEQSNIRRKKKISEQISRFFINRRPHKYRN